MTVLCFSPVHTFKTLNAYINNTYINKSPILQSRSLNVLAHTPWQSLHAGINIFTQAAPNLLLAPQQTHKNKVYAFTSTQRNDAKILSQNNSFTQHSSVYTIYELQIHSREQSSTYTAISTNNGAMGSEEAASKN